MHSLLTSFLAGYLHPLTGLDHITVMSAVGVWSVAQRERRAVWLWPATFVAVMLAGALLALTGLTLPGSEAVILGSMIGLGLIAALGLTVPLSAGAALIGVIALVHGYAHLIEMPAGLNTAAYMTGFALATALLHGAGIALGLTLTTKGPRSCRCAS